MTNQIQNSIEAILFVASKPLSLAAIARTLKVKEADVAAAVEGLKAAYNHDGSGIHILTIGDEIQMGTNPEHATAIEGFVKDEVAGELTKAQLETLTVIAYRGPMTRPELEQIRGVNCALILRNLLLRGLVEEQGEGDILAMYSLSFEALRHLGIRNVSELTEYETLHAHAHIEQTAEKEEP